MSGKPDFRDAHNLPPAPPDFYSRDYFLGRCGGFAEYTGSGGKELDPIRQTALELTAPRDGERILDLGCGRGELCCAIARAGALSLGADFSFDALAMARETAAKLGVTVLLVRCRAEALPFRSGALDGILATDIVEHLPDPDLRRTVTEVHDALRPGGRFVVHTAPTREFMAVGQHLKRFIQKVKGEPVAPVLTLESELREAGHSNIHSRASLTAALASAFRDPRVTYAFSDRSRGGRRMAQALGLVAVLGFNLWAVVRREGGRT
jgi:SAM-dependent methyltransferase